MGAEEGAATARATRSAGRSGAENPPKPRGKARKRGRRNRVNIYSEYMLQKNLANCAVAML